MERNELTTEMLFKNLVIPERVLVEEDKISYNFGRFIIQPLERGYGITLGNALRRVLLSSIPGAAIVGVKIEGVHHEFSTIPGVIEDVVDLIINLKQVKLRLFTDEAKVIRVEKKGPGELKAKDIEVDPEIQVLNPEHHIASLNKDAHLVMNLQIENGKGYVPAEEFKSKFREIGLIPLDADFSPIKKVNFKVENIRVGKRTDYERLIMEIWTYGNISPDSALKSAAQILIRYFRIFDNIELPFKEEKEEKEESREKAEIKKEILSLPLEDIGLPQRAINGFKSADINTVGELVKRTREDLKSIRNLGEKTIDEVENILKEHGLRLGMKEEL